MKKLILLLLVSAWAQAVEVEVEPIAGYERTVQILPTAHTTDYFVYGAAVLVGVPLVSVEAEYTRGQYSQSFPTISTSSSQLLDRAKVGLRSRLRIYRFLSFFLRAGATAKRSIRTDTVGPVTVTTEDPIAYKPYAGAGLQLRVGRNIFLGAGLTAVFNDFPNSYTNNEYQATLGMRIAFGSRRRYR